MCLCDSADDVTQTSNEITAFSPLLFLPVRRLVALSVIVGASMHPMVPFIFRPLRKKHLSGVCYSFFTFFLSLREQGPFLE